MLSLSEIIHMLHDRDGWRLVTDDEATYRHTGIYAYLNCNGVRFRRYGTPPYESNEIVYEVNVWNVIAVILLWVFTVRLRRYLNRRKV